MSGFNSCDLCMHCLGQKSNFWQKTQLQLSDKNESAVVCLRRMITWTKA